MFPKNSAIIVLGILIGAAAPAYAQQIANMNRATSPEQQVPVVAAQAAGAPATRANSELTVKQLSNLHREQVESEIRQKIRTANGSDKPKVTNDRESQCSIANYQLLSVYGMSGRLRADIVLCGTAILTVTRGNEVGDGWRVATIQTSHLTVTRGKQVKQIWMPVPKEQLPTAPTNAQGSATAPMSLPPLPPNLAPSPYRAVESEATPK